MAIIGIDEILKRVKEQGLIENLSQRELKNPEGVGIDLRLGKVSKIIEGGAFIEADNDLELGKRKGVKVEVVAEYSPTETVTVELAPNDYYLVQTIETVNMPEDLISITYGRGSLMKAGVMVISSKTDPGYKGPLVFGIKNLSHFPVRLELGARIVNIFFFEVKGSSVSYRGQHQGGRLSIEEEETQV